MEDVFLLGAVLVLLCGVLIILSIRKTARGFTDEDHPWDPPQFVNEILTPEECKYLIEQAEPKFSRSMVVGAGADGSRTSETAWISKDDPVAQKVFAKALEFSGKTNDHCENLQVVKYGPGTFYKAHHDSCCDETQGCMDFENDGGQRVATLLVYLNSEFTDGETHFPKLNLKMKANPGSGIIFFPLGNNDDRCHPKALHAGLPPSSGVKYVCNAWIRENKFR